MKKICVVSNVIGNRDVIKDSKNGYIANNLDEFVEKIENINKKLDDNITDLAQKDIIKIFNSDNSIKQYINLYSK